MSETINNKKIVVIGGSGFIGSNVADVLSDAGFKVLIFDSQDSKWLRKDQEMFKGDILCSKDLDKALNNSYAVFNFAGIADIKEANAKPLEAVKINILGTTLLLESCIKQKVKKFVFASSLYIYSESGGIYSSTKQACEFLIEDYSKNHGLEFSILRFGSLYGNRANDFNPIRKLISQALVNGEMTREGLGEEIRDYIHVKDAAKCCLTVLEEEKNQYFMITGTQTIKIKDLLTMIQEILNNKVKISYEEIIDQSHYRVTPFTFKPRIAKKINLKLSNDLGQGILDTIHEVYEDLQNDPKVEINTKIFE
ncbi:NAD(P)-dependent oxidoreductase [Gammaproteobacteria bacterium]|nr:NAD(P)-dependent oxidoreductase [Gammaproteobacteria bacterium]